MNGKKHWGWLCCMCLFGPIHLAAEEEASFEVVLDLENGERVSGEYLSTSGKGFKVKPYWLEESLFLPLADVRGYRSLEVPSKPYRPGDQVVFRSGTFLGVQPTGVLDEMFEVEVPWGESVRLPRNAIKRFCFRNGEGLIYDGPQYVLNGQSEITHAPLSFSYAGLQWETPEIPFPTRFLVDIEMDTAAQDFSYQVFLFNGRKNTGSFIVFEVSQDRLSANQISRNHDNMHANSWRIQKEISGPQLRQHLQIFVNIPDQRFTLMLNQEILHTWEGDMVDAVSSVEQPGIIGIRYRNGVGQIRLTSLRVLPWEGEAPEMESLEGVDQILLKGGRILKGTLLDLNREHALLQTKGREDPVSIPVHELYEIYPRSAGLPSENPEEPPSAILNLFENGDSLNVSIVSLVNGILETEVLTGGDSFVLPVPLSAIQDVQIPGGALE